MKQAIGGRGPWLAGALLLIVLAIGLRVAVAFAGRTTAMESGRAVIRDPDACYHLRRAALIADRFPDLALFDSYMNHPRGAHVIWPPLYDLVLAGALRSFPAEAPGTSAAVALLPPLLFAGAVLVIFRVARAVWPDRPGRALLAALIPALLPASLPYTGFALFDHHAAELLMTAIAVAAISGALARGEEMGQATWRAAVGLGVALAAALLTQLSLILLLGLAPMCALLAPSGRRARALATIAWALALAALLVLPWGLLYARGGAPFRHYQFGLFQPALAAAAAFGTGIVAALASRHPRRIAIALGCALPLLGLALLLGREIAGGLGYVGRSAPWLASIGESQPVFAAGFTRGAQETMIQLSALALLLPVAWFQLLRAGGRDPARRTILLASVLFAVLGITQRRFLPHLSLFVGFGAMFALERFVARAPRRRRIRPALAVVIGIALVAAFLPCIAALQREEEPVIAFDRARPVLDYLRTHTPPTSHYADPRAPGEYGVLAEWSFGHFIQYHGQRPAVTDNFGDHAGDPLRPRDFFLATEEARALALADSLQVRYVLVRDLVAGFQGLIPDTEITQRFVARAVPHGSRATIEFAAAIEPTLLYRLAWRYGSGFPGAGGFVPPVARLRLVAESQALEPVSGGGEVPYVKLYEIVRGAELQVAGLAPREEGVFLSAVRSPNGRRFPYVILLQADASGTIAATIPYPTTAGEGVSWIDEGEIRIGREAARRLALPTITEDDVESGRRIALADSLSSRTP